MAALKELVAHFYGRDPIAGEDARLELIKGQKAGVIEALIPLDGCSYGSSPQVEARLKSVAEALGPQIVPHLARAISSGPWSSKLVAAPCFAGFEDSKETQTPLIEILESGGNFDAERLAIEALGFLGADGWAFDLTEYGRFGSWRFDRSNLGDDRVSEYAFGKLSSYVVEALTRFAARCKDRDHGHTLFSALTRFVELCQVHLPNRTPDAYQLVERHGNAFTEWSVDHLIGMWGRHKDEGLQRLCMDILAHVAPVRATKFLLETAVSPSHSNSVRIGASIALGEIRHPQAAQRLATVMKDPTIDKASLDWAFSTLYALPADWAGESDYVDRLLAENSEPANQLRYSLALRGDDRCKADLIDRLDDEEPHNRWMAALALARLLGPESRPYLESRAEDAGDIMERCAMYAASVRAGEADKTVDLHAALQEATFASMLRSVWKLEILDAFHSASTFDARAFPLWRVALQAGARQVQYFEAMSPNQELQQTSKRATRSLKPASGKTKVFISYSHSDTEWLERFQKMLSPLIRTKRLDLWDDTKITPGKWRPQIEVAMSESHVALFLVSDNFLASDFIMEHELPDLLRSADERDVTVLWVLLDHCLWEETPLADYQGENAGNPLSQMSQGECTQTIKNTCVQIRDLLSVDR